MLLFACFRYFLFFTLMAIFIAIFGVMFVIFFPLIILVLFCL